MGQHGKTLDEARGEMRRVIEKMEVSIGIPSLVMCYNVEDIAAGIDERAVLQPMGNSCCVAPFNFRVMDPLVP